MGITRTLISGSPKEAIQKLSLDNLPQNNSISFLTPALFVEGAKSDFRLEDRSFWLYRAPWIDVMDSSTSEAASKLTQWQVEQVAALQLRRHLRDRIIFINVDRVSPAELGRQLNISDLETKFQPVSMTPLMSALASLFEQVVPECWSLYEALEAVAWLPDGEPELRSNLAPPSLEGLNELLALIQAGKQLPAAMTMLGERDLALGKSQKDLISACAANETTQKEASLKMVDHELRLGELRREITKLRANEEVTIEKTEFLLSQLHLAQEELERYYLANKEMLATMEQSEAVIHRTRHLISRIAAHA